MNPSAKRWTAPPVFERERLYPAPRRGLRRAADAQSAAVGRLHSQCERLRPHLESGCALRSHIAGQPDPSRVRKRISVALAMQDPETDFIYGFVGEAQIEAFRKHARRRPALNAWVFS